MKLTNIIKNLSPSINEGSQQNKIIFLYKKDVDVIRKKNAKLNEILSYKVFYDENVYLKGGAARLALQLYLGLDADNAIRDVDLCYIGDAEEYREKYSLSPKKEYDHQIDYEGDSFELYFKTRDVTLNEVVIRPDLMAFTRRAYRDFTSKRVNARTDSSHFLTIRAHSRALLFAARYGYELSPNVKSEAWWLGDRVNPFEYMVCLLKAYELGIQQKYFNICKKYGITKTKNVSYWLADMLTTFGGGFSLLGREGLIAKDLSNIDSEFLNNLYSEYPKLETEVENIRVDDKDYSKYLTKPNRK